MAIFVAEWGESNDKAVFAGRLGVILSDGGEIRRPDHMLMRWEVTTCRVTPRHADGASSQSAILIRRAGQAGGARYSPHQIIFWILLFII